MSPPVHHCLRLCASGELSVPSLGTDGAGGSRSDLGTQVTDSPHSYDHPMGPANPSLLPPRRPQRTAVGSPAAAKSSSSRVFLVLEDPTARVTLYAMHRALSRIHSATRCRCWPPRGGASWPNPTWTSSRRRKERATSEIRAYPEGVRRAGRVDRAVPCSTVPPFPVRCRRSLCCR